MKPCSVGFPWSDEVEPHRVVEGPCVEHLRRKLSAIVDCDESWVSPLLGKAVEGLRDSISGECATGLKHQTLAVEDVDHREHAKRAFVGERSWMKSIAQSPSLLVG
jgi:hypothetical protein